MKQFRTFGPFLFVLDLQETAPVESRHRVIDTNVRTRRREAMERIAQIAETSRNRWTSKRFSR
jgi:hypothetical protein